MSETHGTGRGYLLVAASLFLLVLDFPQAVALDCRQAESLVDKAICANANLLKADSAMAAGFSQALRDAKGDLHDILLRDQRRWLAIRGLECGASLPADASRDECIRDASKGREGELRDFAKSARPLLEFEAEAARGSTGGPFAGDWSRCSLEPQGLLICDFKKLFQNGSRVCGFWQSYASGRYYEGRLIGEATGDSVAVKAICGRPGSETQHECPEWERSDAVLRRCEGKPAFLAKGSVACDRAKAVRVGFQQFPHDPQADFPLRDFVSSSELRDWTASCLRDPELPQTLPRN